MLLPAGIVLLLVLRSRSWKIAWSKWGSDGSNQRLMAMLPRPKWGWVSTAGIFLVAMAAVNPQWGYKKVAVDTKSADIYLLLDISNSMLAEDIAPNRLERAKRLALDISTAFKTDKVGLILFAGNAYMQSPLTTDWHAIQLYLSAANPDQAGTQGTAIGEAVRLALKSHAANDDAVPGALILLTDGEDHDTDAPAAISDAASAGWVTYVIGIGTAAGSTIPVMIDGNKDLKRDENGQPVKTALNEPLMKELVQKGNGKYYSISQDPSIVEDLRNELNTLARNQMEKRSFSEHKSYFQWFLLPGLILLLVPVVINYRFDEW